MKSTDAATDDKVYYPDDEKWLKRFIAEIADQDGISVAAAYRRAACEAYGSRHAGIRDNYARLKRLRGES